MQTETRTPRADRLPTWAAVSLLVGLGLLVILLHNWVYIFNAPSKEDLTDGQRRVLMLNALERGTLPVLRDDGQFVALRREDIAEVGRSRCEGVHECTRTARGRRRTNRICKEVETKLSCGYELVRRDGGTAAALLLTGRGRSYMSIPDIRSTDAVSLQYIVTFQFPSEGEARQGLCALGYCTAADIARFKPRTPTASAVADPDAAARAACQGVFTTIVGRGRVCIDPADAQARVVQDCKDGFCGPPMVVLPTGRYQRGIDEAELAALQRDFPDFNKLGVDEHPARQVVIDYALAIGSTELTFEHWDACYASHTCRGMTRAEDFGWGRGEQPVVNISWQEIATIYLPWLNERLGLRGAEAYRLPSDGEWEYAARAGSTTRYPGGPLLSKERANFHAAPINAPRGRPLPIGRHAPNAFGVVDMIGNVAEWVEDCLTFPSSAVRDLPTDGRARTKTVFEETCGSNELRVVRGGSYNQTAESVRVTARVLTASTTRSPQIGVRLARTLAGTRPSGPPVPTQVGPVFR